VGQATLPAAAPALLARRVRLGVPAEVRPHNGGGMLLYDMVREHAERTLRHMGPEAFGKRNLQDLADLCDCQVYEISDVVSLVEDYARDKDKALPRRPPHTRVWAEWRCRDATEDGQSYDAWTLGALVRPLGEEARKLLVERPPAPDGTEALAETLGPAWGGPVSTEAFVAAMAPGRECYAVQMFKRLDGFRHDPKNYQAQLGGASVSFEESDRAIREGLNKPACDIGFLVWSHNNDGSGVYRHKFYPRVPEGADALEAARANTFFFLRLAGSFDYREHWQVVDPWPAFMAFALLHCKNVIAEDVVPAAKIQHQCRKHNRPPRITFKVLRIEVPKTAHARQSYEGGEDDDAGPRVRFHVCSGFFRHLQSDRYVNKKGQWVWVPAHWRGSKDLGEVNKRYQLTPNRQGGSPATSG
jgi:hypothetical protein